MDSNTNKYIYSRPCNNSSLKDKIDNCYNYYKSQRDTLFHFGDIIGSTDNTRPCTKECADEIINSCLALINEQI